MLPMTHPHKIYKNTHQIHIAHAHQYLRVKLLLPATCQPNDIPQLHDWDTVDDGNH